MAPAAAKRGKKRFSGTPRTPTGELASPCTPSIKEVVHQLNIARTGVFISDEKVKKKVLNRVIR